MCGIAGIVDRTKARVPEQLYQALQKIHHRGPDDEGLVAFGAQGGPRVYYGKHTASPVLGIDAPYRPVTHIADAATTPDAVVALGHKRLSIIDLSAMGHQPMSDPDKQIWLIFNGEIYNYRKLRTELESLGHSFYSETDTEVLLLAFKEWGEGFVHRLKGMFSLALFHREAQLLYLYRDRFGIKPLYYAQDKNHLWFSSEPDAILAMNPWLAKLNTETAHSYLRHEVVDQSEQTFFQDIKSLPAGHFLRYNTRTGDYAIKAYYNLAQAVIENVDLVDATDIRQRLLTGLRQSVSEHMEADVPVAMCLSGGLDSSTIACLLRLDRGEDYKINTFTSHYGDPRFDEDRNVNEVTSHIHSNHHYQLIKAEDAFADAERMISDLGEPATRVGVYSQWKLFQRVRSEGLKVTLDGQGADEMFAGYDDYFSVYFKYLKSEKRGIRYFSDMGFLMKNHGIRKAAYLLEFAKKSFKSTSGLSDDLLSTFQDKSPYPDIHLGSLDPFNKALYWSLAMGSLPHCLRICDRNSMAHSVESRVPYLDHELVELAFSLLPEEKMGFGTSKRILRQTAKGILPNLLRKDPMKVGFWLNMDNWYRNPKGVQVFEEVLYSKSFRERGVFNAPKCQSAYESFLKTGTTDENFWLWLNFELWARQKLDHAPPRISS